MHATKTRTVRMYLRAGKQGDLTIRHRLETDVRAGISASETLRRALSQYYGLDKHRPTPPSPNGGTDPAVAQALLLMAGHVRDLADEVARLKAEVRELRAELRAAVEG